MIRYEGGKELPALLHYKNRHKVKEERGRKALELRESLKRALGRRRSEIPSMFCNTKLPLAIELAYYITTYLDTIFLC